MRKVVAGAMVSLDGVMQAPGGPQEDPTGGFAYGGWVFNYFDEAAGAYMDEQFGRPFDLLLGRRTYEIFAAHWPYQEDSIGAAFNRVTKYVATRSDMPLAWDGSVRLKDAVADVARLKQEDGPELLTQGSTVLLQDLHRAGLIDEYRLLIFPLVLGKGKRLFEDGAAAAGLGLERSRTFPTGVIAATYLPAGPVVPGNFPGDNPSQAERARREKLRREA